MPTGAVRVLLCHPKARTHSAPGSEAREAREGARVGGQQWEPLGTQSSELICKETGFFKLELWIRRWEAAPRSITRAPRGTEPGDWASRPAPAISTTALPVSIVASEISGTAAHSQNKEAGGLQ